MLRNWPLLFIIIPVIEIFLLIKVGSHIGALWTVLLVITTAVIGVNLLRYQGVATLTRAQQSMSQGTMPAMEMMEGLCLAVGGALLITPGFMTDSIGFFCLVPVTRRALIRYIMKNATMNMHNNMSGMNAQQGFYGTSRPHQPSNQKNSQTSNTRSGRTFEGEYTKEDD